MLGDCSADKFVVNVLFFCERTFSAENCLQGFFMNIKFLRCLGTDKAFVALQHKFIIRSKYIFIAEFAFLVIVFI